MKIPVRDGGIFCAYGVRGGMKAYFSILLFILSLGMAGCPTTEPTPTVIDTKGLTESVAKLEELARKNEEANKKVDEIKRKSLSKGSASVRGILEANKNNPEGLPKTAIEKEGEIAVSALPEPEKEDLVDSLNRVKMVLEGRLAEVKDFYSKAKTELEDLKVRAISAEKERELAKADKDAAILKAKGEVEDIRVKSKVNEDGMRAAFEIKEKEKDGEIRRLGQGQATADWAKNGRWLAGTSLTAAIYAFYCFYIRKDAPAGFAAASGCVLAAVGSIFCYMLSSFVGQPIFMTLSIWFGVALVVLGIVSAIIFFIVHSKDKARKIESEKGREDVEMGNYVYQELHDSFNKAKELFPEAAEIVGKVLKERLSEDSKIFIDRTTLKKKEANLPK